MFLHKPSLNNSPFEGKEKQSSWLSDALLELDPSCDKLTFLGIPASEETNSNNAQPKSKATLRITAEGTFGSTQVSLTLCII